MKSNEPVTACHRTPEASRTHCRTNRGTYAVDAPAGTVTPTPSRERPIPG
jgi:hypothetical protein